MSESPLLRVLTPENRAWVETLMIPMLLSQTNPCEFLWALCQALFPAVHASRDDDKELLKDVQAILGVYKVPLPDDLLPVCDLLQDGVDQAEPKACFNAVIENTRKFLKSDEELRATLAADLDDRYVKCEELAAQLRDVTGENAFYHGKLKRIEKLITSLPESGSTRRAIEQCLEDFYEDD